jgi:hypothetical protein
MTVAISFFMKGIVSFFNKCKGAECHFLTKVKGQNVIF